MKGRFFVTLDPESEDRASLDAAGARHLRALRLTRGDAVRAIVAPGRERAAVIASLERERVLLTLGDELPAARRDLAHERTLAIALGDLTRMDLVIEKATELGATAIQPFVAERSQARTLAPSRLERWRRIARTACEQCGRTVEPAIHECIAFAELAERCAAGSVVWLLTPAGEAHDPASAPAQIEAAPASGSGRQATALLLVVGPEGGLSDQEAGLLRERGARPITLGHRTLRFETAAIAALSAALVHFPEDP